MTSARGGLRLRPRVLLEEPRRTGEELDHVLLAGERMALVLGHHVLDGDLAAAERADDEVGFRAWDARIVCPSVDEERSLDLVDVAHRRDGVEEGGVLHRIANSTRKISRMRPPVVAMTVFMPATRKRSPPARHRSGMRGTRTSPV